MLGMFYHKWPWTIADLKVSSGKQEGKRGRTWVLDLDLKLSPSSAITSCFALGKICLSLNLSFPDCKNANNDYYYTVVLGGSGERVERKSFCNPSKTIMFLIKHEQLPVVINGLVSILSLFLNHRTHILAVAMHLARVWHFLAASSCD